MATVIVHTDVTFQFKKKNPIWKEKSDLSSAVLTVVGKKTQKSGESERKMQL